MIEILFIVLPLFLLLLSVGLNVYFRATAFKAVIACADAQSARVLPAPPVEGGVVGTAAAPLDPLVSIILPVQNEAEPLLAGFQPLLLLCFLKKKARSPILKGFGLYFSAVSHLSFLNVR